MRLTLANQAPLVFQKVQIMQWKGLIVIAVVAVGAVAVAMRIRLVRNLIMPSNAASAS